MSAHIKHIHSKCDGKYMIFSLFAMHGANVVAALIRLALTLHCDALHCCSGCWASYAHTHCTLHGDWPITDNKKYVDILHCNYSSDAVFNLGLSRSPLKFIRSEGKQNTRKKKTKECSDAMGPLYEMGECEKGNFVILQVIADDGYSDAHLANFVPNAVSARCSVIGK